MPFFGQQGDVVKRATTKAIRLKQGRIDFNTDKNRKQGTITTLSVTVPHSSYWFTIKPQDICISQTNVPVGYFVERVKITGGTGKVTQCELQLVLTDQGTAIPVPKQISFPDYFDIIL
jgi:hypothetical protein